MKLVEKESELEIAHKEAYTLQGSNSGMKHIGAVEGKDGKVSLFYKDQENKYWYETKYRVQDKLISEEEFIFGRKITHPRYMKRSGKY